MSVEISSHVGTHDDRIKASPMSWWLMSEDRTEYLEPFNGAIMNDCMRFPMIPASKGSGIRPYNSLESFHQQHIEPVLQ
jgi:hypothetical protein